LLSFAQEGGCGDLADALEFFEGSSQNRVPKKNPMNPPANLSSSATEDQGFPLKDLKHYPKTHPNIWVCTPFKPHKTLVQNHKIAAN